MSTLPPDIKHIVVLMLENRSFDNLLGKVPGVDGPGIQTNRDPKLGDFVPVSFDAGPVSPALEDPNNKGQFIGGPPHDFISVNRQLFEVATPVASAKLTLGGFVAAARQSTEDNADFIAREVMKCFDTPNQLKTMAALAAEFMVCDHWYSSVPGPTWPNRLFTHCGTSFGKLDNTIRSYPGPTIYDRLSAEDIDWAIYYHDFAQSMCLGDLSQRMDRRGRNCIRGVEEFYKEVRAHKDGDPSGQILPSYTFIEPGYFEPSHGLLGRIKDAGLWLAHALGFPIRPSGNRANDQHAPHDVRFGEHLIADVYEALRSNEDVWQHCLFIVVHDEHGGLYDHEPPGPAVPPDTTGSADPPFMFDRRGLRVPAILISPFIKQGVDLRPYEHTSIINTVRQHFCATAAPLTERDKSAPVLPADLFGPLRPDTTRRLTRPTPAFAIKQAGDPSKRPLNDLQASLVHLAAAVDARPPAPAAGGVMAAAARAAGPVDLSATPFPAVSNEADAFKFAHARRSR